MPEAEPAPDAVDAQPPAEAPETDMQDAGEQPASPDQDEEQPSES